MIPQAYPLQVLIRPTDMTVAKYDHHDYLMAGWYDVIGWDDLSSVPMVVAQHQHGLLMVGEMYEVLHWARPTVVTERHRLPPLWWRVKESVLDWARMRLPF